MINLKQALVNPSSVFREPLEVLLNSEITRDQKIQILKRWKSDLVEIQVAEEENMQGQDQLLTFEEVLKALHVLDASFDIEHNPPPTKQRG